MDKNARNRSSDTAQEALREEKSNWNHFVSGLISEIIAFKRAVNGKGDTGLGLPSSNIKYPIPSEVANFLSKVTSDFNSMTSGANHIFDAQRQYSEHRQKGRLEQAVMKEASWWGSRFLAKLKFLTISKEIRELRIKLLKTSVVLSKDLKELESNISGGDLFKFILKLRNFSYSFLNLLVSDFKKLKTIEDKSFVKPVELDTKSPEPEAPKKQVGEIIHEEEPPKAKPLTRKREVSKMLGSLVRLQLRINQLEGAGVDEKTIKSLMNISTSLDSILYDLNSFTEEKLLNEEKFNLAKENHKELINQIESLENQFTKKAELFSEADLGLKRWLTRKYLGMQSGVYPQISLEIINKIIDLKKQLNSFMDLIEDGDTPIVLVENEYKEVCETLKSILERSLDIGNIYKSEVDMNTLEGQKIKTFKKEYLTELVKLKSLLEKHV